MALGDTPPLRPAAHSREKEGTIVSSSTHTPREGRYRRLALTATLIAGAAAGCDKIASPAPVEQRAVIVAVDVSDSFELSAARCGAAADIIRAELADLSRGTLKATLWVSGTKKSPEPELIQDVRFAPTRAGKMLKREQREAGKLAFADAFETECEALLSKIKPRDASPIFALIKRAIEQHHADCEALEMMGDQVCAPAPIMLIVSDLREAGGHPVMEQRLKQFAKQRQRPRSKVTIPEAPLLGLPEDARVIACGVGGQSKKTITVADAVNAWTTSGLLGSAVIRPRCAPTKQSETNNEDGA